VHLALLPRLVDMHLPLRSLNHVSTVVADVRKSVEFFERVLGFSEIKRPDSFDFGGAW
jgi:catechol 2,3-dioxygenase-like lactoylglutathione lyase family enzyme